MKPNKIIEIQANNSEIRIRVKKKFKTYFSKYINEDVLFRRFVTCMDFGRGFAEDIVNNDWIQSLKERGIYQLCPVLLFFC